MPDINFPNSPSGGDTYTFNNIVFSYDGEKWTAKGKVTTSVTNGLVIEDGVRERYSSLTGATGVVAHDCDNGHIFYHTSISANFTANFTNLSLSDNYSTNLTLILNQGVTARIPSALQIAGSAQTINWQGGSEPSGTSNGIDAVSFTILRDSSSYIVLGQLVDFT